MEFAGPVRDGRRQPELLLRELNHRWLNDMQLILALLSNAARSAASPEAKAALVETAEKVGVIAANRAHLRSATEADLERALSRAARTIDALCDDRITVRLQVSGHIPMLKPDLVLVVVLAVNEIATNAIKHAFPHDGCTGTILICAEADDERFLRISVEDDGQPWRLDRAGGAAHKNGGLELVRRMVAAHGGLFLPPHDGTKRFEFRFKPNLA